MTFFVGSSCGNAIKKLPEAETYYDAPFLHSERKALPKELPSIHRDCYSLNYDCRTKNASWVYERLTVENLQGNEDRENFNFKEDHIIPEIFRSTIADYRGSGFDRGHLAPAANHKNNPEAMADTFFMSNMSPQHPKLNRGYWSKLEKYVRDLTKSYPVVHVITGPLFLPQEEADGKRWVKYQVIGKNDVAVPTHFFKVIVLEKASGQNESRAYIIPNQSIKPDTPIENFRTTTQKVERAAGLRF